MRTLANIIWHIPFLGFLNAFIVFLWGSFLTLTIVGAPIGLGMLQLSKFLMSPFSSILIDKGELTTQQNKLWKAYGFIVRIIYFPLGLFLALVTIAQAVLLTFTIVGIPLAIILAKSLGTYFNPVNKISVPREVQQTIAARKHEK